MQIVNRLRYRYSTASIFSKSTVTRLDELTDITLSQQIPGFVNEHNLASIRSPKYISCWIW